MSNRCTEATQDPQPGQPEIDGHVEVPTSRDVQWWPETDFNRRQGDFQSPALPSELPGRGQRLVRIPACPRATVKVIYYFLYEFYPACPYLPFDTKMITVEFLGTATPSGTCPTTWLIGSPVPLHCTATRFSPSDFSVDSAEDADLPTTFCTVTVAVACPEGTGPPDTMSPTMVPGADPKSPLQGTGRRPAPCAVEP